MKKILLTITLLSGLIQFNCSSSGSETDLQKAQLTAPTKLLLLEYNKAKEAAEKNSTKTILPEKVVNDYSLTKKDGRYFARAIITVSDLLDENQLALSELVVNSKMGNSRTISFPLDLIGYLLKIDGIELIDISIKLKIKNEEK